MSDESVESVTELNRQRYTEGAVFCILCAILGSSVYTYLQEGVWQGIKASYDYGVFHAASQVIREGRTDLLYDIEWFYSLGVSGPYLYFPFLAILLSPLSFFSFEQARIAWMGINQLFLVGSLGFVISSLQVRDVRIVLGIIILSVSFGPLHANMWWGNVNALLMLLILVAWWSYKRNRRVICGLAIGLGAVIKITPAIFGVYFLYKRDYRVALYSIAGFVIAVIASVVVLGGYQEHLDWYTNILPFLNMAGGKGASVINQSFYGTYLRLADNGFFTVEDANLLHLVSECAILLLSFALCRFSKLRPDSEEFDLEFACIACLPVLMPPVSGPPNFVAVFPAFLIVLVFLFNHRPRVFVSMLFGISYLSVSLGAFGSDAFSRWPLVLLQSSKLFGMLILYAISAAYLIRIRRNTLPDEIVPRRPAVNQT